MVIDMPRKDVHDNVNDESSSSDDISIIYPKATPSSAKSKPPRMATGLDPENNLPVSASTEEDVDSRSTRFASSPGSQNRYTTRSTGKAKERPNYNLRFHPMDAIMRPNAKRTRVDEQKESAIESDDEQKIRVMTKSRKGQKQGPSASSGESASAASTNLEDSGINSENLFTRPIEEDWHTMNSYDRYLFRLQGGAPLTGTALRMKWPAAVRVLIREKFFTRKQFNVWGGEKMMKERYELVRLAMRRLFGATKEEPSDRKDWTVYYQEGWEVFDLPSTSVALDGSKTFEENPIENDRKNQVEEDLGEGSEDEDEDSADESAIEVSLTDLEGSPIEDYGMQAMSIIKEALEDQEVASVESSQHIRSREITVESGSGDDPSNASTQGEASSEATTVILESNAMLTRRDGSRRPVNYRFEDSVLDESGQDGTAYATPVSLDRDEVAVSSGSSSSGVESENKTHHNTIQAFTPINRKRGKQGATKQANFTIHEDSTNDRSEKQLLSNRNKFRNFEDTPKENIGDSEEDNGDLLSGQLVGEWDPTDLEVARTPGMPPIPTIRRISATPVRQVGQAGIEVLTSAYSPPSHGVSVVIPRRSPSVLDATEEEATAVGEEESIEPETETSLRRSHRRTAADYM